MNQIPRISSTHNLTPKPWGESPEKITIWFDEGTSLKDIARGVLMGDKKVINRLNTLASTLGIERIICPDSEQKDIIYFLQQLSQKNNSFISKFHEKILMKVNEEQGYQAREFIELIGLGLDCPQRVIELIKNEKIFLEEKTNISNIINTQILEILEGPLKGLGISLGSIYILLLFFRIFGMP